MKMPPIVDGLRVKCCGMGAIEEETGCFSRKRPVMFDSAVAGVRGISQRAEFGKVTVGDNTTATLSMCAKACGHLLTCERREWQDTSRLARLGVQKHCDGIVSLLFFGVGCGESAGRPPLGVRLRDTRRSSKETMNAMRLGRHDKGAVRVRPSRLYSLFDGSGLGAAGGAIFFALLGVSCVFVVLGGGGGQVRSSPWLLIPGLFFAAVMALGAFLVAAAIWISVPARVVLTTLDKARALCADRSFVLILWSFREYQDLLGTTTEYGGLRARRRVNVQQGMDSYIAEVADDFKLRSIRLWCKNAPRFVDGPSNSIHAICPDLIWKEVVLVALHAAVAVVLVSGRGEGLAWEREVVVTSAELDAKTLSVSGLKVTELKAALKTHLQRVTAKVGITSHI